MRVLIFLGILLTAGCGGSADEASEAVDGSDRPTVFDPMTETLDRAQGVEDTLRDSAAERQRQLELAEGG